jgi:hypothetical protein
VAIQQTKDNIPRTIRYALIATSISSQADSIAPDLINAMAQAQVLSFNHALTMVREISIPAQRAIGLALLSNHSSAPDGLETEALAARDLVRSHFPDNEMNRVAVDARLLKILPISVPAPGLGSESDLLLSMLRPPLQKMFARRFLTMRSSDFAAVAKIFKHSDSVAANELLKLIDAAWHRPQQGRKRFRISSKKFKSRTEWKVQRLESVMKRPPGAEEVAAALIGLSEAGVSIIENTEQLALEAIQRISGFSGAMAALRSGIGPAVWPEGIAAQGI